MILVVFAVLTVLAVLRVLIIIALLILRVLIILLVLGVLLILIVLAVSVIEIVVHYFHLLLSKSYDYSLSYLFHFYSKRGRIKRCCHIWQDRKKSKR